MGKSLLGGCRISLLIRDRRLVSIPVAKCLTDFGSLEIDCGWKFCLCWRLRPLWKAHAVSVVWCSFAPQAVREVPSKSYMFDVSKAVS